MSKKFPFIERRQPTEKDLNNLAALRTGGGSPGSNSGPELLRSSDQDPKEELTFEQRRKILNDQERERRLQQLQDRLEIQNELKESGFLIHRVNR